MLGECYEYRWSGTQPSLGVGEIFLEEMIPKWSHRHENERTERMIYLEDNQRHEGLREVKQLGFT